MNIFSISSLGNPTIFRLVDFWKPDIEETIYNLRSHIKYGLLSVYEAQNYPEVSWLGVGNILENPHAISVFSSKRGYLKWNHGLFMFTEGLNKVWVITDAPTIENPEKNWSHGLDHLIIDAKNIPLEQRQVTGIIISEINIDCIETINEILEIWKENNLPVYQWDNMKLELMQHLKNTSNL